MTDMIMSHPFQAFFRQYSPYGIPLLMGHNVNVTEIDSNLPGCSPTNKNHPSQHRPISLHGQEKDSCPQFRNWMIENDEGSSSSDHSASPAAPSRSCSGELDVSELPSPSRLSFFPRKRRDSKKERRARTTFTSQQTQILELEYRRSEYVTRPRRYELATQLYLKEVQIKIWYQNRRAKDKRIEKATWDRQYRCLGLTTSSSQLPSTATGNYRLNPALSPVSFATASLHVHHPLHMFPTSAATFPLPLLEQLQANNSRHLTSFTHK